MWGTLIVSSHAPSRYLLHLGYVEYILFELADRMEVAMSHRKVYRCPVCKKTLTQKEYERALGILGERERHLQHQKEDLQKGLRNAKLREKKARAEGVTAERDRTQRLLKGKDRQIATLEETLKQLKKGSCPQTEGLEFEDKLAVRLRREFPTDDVEHKGKGGDVLHSIRFDGKVAGIIIYECKRTPRILPEHVRQTQRAKQSRDADFAVLVTTGTKRGFSGLACMSGVLVVSPLGAVPLAALLRSHLIEMMRARITKEKRARIADQLVQYITSPQFRNPIEEVIQVASELRGMIFDEAKQHRKVWERRWKHYKTIEWDSSQIQNNVQLVLHGKQPQPLAAPKVAQPLLLPAPE